MKNLKNKYCVVNLSDYVLNQLPRLSTEVIIPVVRNKTAEKHVVHVIQEMLKVSKLIKKYKIEIK